MKLMEQIGPGEKVLWFGKKARHVSAAEALLNPVLPIALIWIAFEAFFFFDPVPLSELDGNRIVGLIFGLLPLWIYLIVALCIGFGSRKTEYCVTDKGIYVIYANSIPKKLVMKRFGEIQAVRTKRGIYDRFLGTGDVSVMCYSEVNEPNANIEVNGVPLKSANELTIQNIPDYQSVMLLIQQHQKAAEAENNYINEPENMDSGTRPLPGARSIPAPHMTPKDTVFGQPVSAQPMFSDPERGFNAVRGSFVAGGQPQSFGTPMQPTAYGQPQSKPPVQAAPQTALLQQTNAPLPAQTASAPMPELTVPDVPQAPAAASVPEIPQVQSALTQNASAQALQFDIPELAQEISLAGQQQNNGGV